MTTGVPNLQDPTEDRHQGLVTDDSRHAAQHQTTDVHSTTTITTTTTTKYIQVRVLGPTTHVTIAEQCMHVTIVSHLVKLVTIAVNLVTFHAFVAVQANHKINRDAGLRIAG
jgi:hypothetical protein